MAIQENVTNNNRMPTPDELAKMAELYAPDVPLNFALGVMSQESNLGRDPKAAKSRLVGISETTGRQQSVIGPGQILDSEESYQKGLPISMAAHWYKKTTGQTYQPGNLQHATIAAFARINNDYVKANGDDLEFSKKYFGGGTDAKSGNKTAETYVTELRQKIYKLGGLESVNNVPIQAKLNTLTGADDPAVKQSAALAAQERKANGENLVDTMRRAGEDVISSLLGMKDAAINTINTEAAESVAKAAQTKDFMIKALGFDPTGDTNNITAAGKVLNKNLGELLNLQEGLANAKANPIFAILDGMSGQKVSKQFVAEIDQRQKVATDISQSINQLHTLAKNASSIGMDTVSQMSEASRLAKIQTLNAKYLHDTVVASGKTDIEAAKIDIKTDAAIKSINDGAERSARQAEQDSLRKSIAELNIAKQSFALAQQQGQADTVLAIKQKQLEKMDLEIAEKQTKVKDKLAKAEVKDKLATAMGTTVAELDLAVENKDPVITELLTNPKSLGAMEYKASKGNLSLDEKTARNLAFGRNGWADKAANSHAQAAEGRVAKALAADKSLSKPAATTSARDARAVNRANLFAAELSTAQNEIISTPEVEANEVNPYAANHGLLLSENATLLTPIMQKSEKLGVLAKEVFESKLYASLIREKKAGMNFKDDEAVIKHATKLLLSESLVGYPPQTAAKELSNYFTLAAETNNLSKNYQAVGVKEQEVYKVNFTAIKRAGVTAYGDNLSEAYPESLSATLPEFKILPVEPAKKGSINNVSVDLMDASAVTNLLLRLAIQQRRGSK